MLPASFHLSRSLQDCQYTPPDVRAWITQFNNAWIQNKSPRTFCFRGQNDAKWPMVSSLWRHVANGKATQPKDFETAMSAEEGDIMKDAYQRGLAFWDGRRTTYLYQLAFLQHYGAPTRLIDVTFDINVALWFACENDKLDGRLCAISVNGTPEKANRSLTELDVPDGRAWVDDYGKPWKNYENWRTEYFCWRPAHFDRRMFAQQGGFLLGGYPQSPARVSRYRDTKTIQDTAPNTSSIAMEWHVADPKQWDGPGKTATALGLSIVIPKKEKKKLRSELERMHGINHQRMFPDFAGAADRLKKYRTDANAVSKASSRRTPNGR